MSVWSTTIPRSIIVAVALSLAAAGCASPMADGAPHEQIALAVPERLSSVTLCVTNPNPDALVFRRVTVTLDLAGIPLATGSSDAALVVPALSSTRMPIVVLATRQGGSVPTRRVSYHVDGSVGLDRAFGLNIPYRHAGHLDVVSPIASGVLSDCAGSDVAVPL